MNNYIEHIIKKVEFLNPIHSKKLKKNFKHIDINHNQLADDFLSKYCVFLDSKNRTLDYAIDCYLKMLADITIETVHFMQTNCYSSTTFEEVNRRVYEKPDVMEYYMHGLFLSQFLWKHHYAVLDYFVSNLSNYCDKSKNYLEIGAGHGFYLSMALKIFPENCPFSVVDISQTSIDIAKELVNNSRVNYHLANIFDYEVMDHYDFIVMGEVLEHVEEPVNLLKKVNNLLSDDGVVFVTTPTNAPTIDHIYLFRSVNEIKEVINQAGFEIISEYFLCVEDIPLEKAEELKITIMYSAFIKKI